MDELGLLMMDLSERMRGHRNVDDMEARADRARGWGVGLAHCAGRGEGMGGAAAATTRWVGGGEVAGGLVGGEGGSGARLPALIRCPSPGGDGGIGGRVLCV